MIEHRADKVHRHICGHSPFSDNELLLIRNKFWTEAVELHPQETPVKCPECRHTFRPNSMRKVFAQLAKLFFQLAGLQRSLVLCAHVLASNHGIRFAVPVLCYFF